jgi:ATP-dependent RNA helicase HelY
VVKFFVAGVSKKDKFKSVVYSRRKDRKKDRKADNTHEEIQRKVLEDLLEGIGVPEPKPFQPDEFQLEALKAIEKFDVLVTAPTGAGKTWIAKEEIRRLLAQGKRAWYTTPLKALTNSKYIEFCEEFGADQVGILTGDRKENPKAPIVVGTTEIYRNQLFDALRKGENVNADFVILDEAHYLSDDDRGHVWEEVIILTPLRIRILLLSATIGNPEELASWIEEVRGSEVKIVKAEKRPVELRAACLLPNLKLLPLLNENSPSYKHFKPSYYYDFLRAPEIPPPHLINALRSFNLLPAIVFTPTRRRCDEAVLEVLNRRNFVDKQKRQKRKEFIQEFEKVYPEIKDHRHKTVVIQAGVASHHAGHLPAWKLLVEKMMAAGLLDAIFATSTVAAGVDFPARTVVILNADTRGNEGWRPLQVNELQQMIGRAGRRGKDKVGFIVLAPSIFQNPMRIASLLKSAPEPLISKFCATYLSLLNLLDAYGSFDQIREIAEKSFAFRKTASQIRYLQQQNAKRLALIRRAYVEMNLGGSSFLNLKKPKAEAFKLRQNGENLETNNPDSVNAESFEKAHEIAEKLLGYERLISARQRLFQQNSRSYEEDFLAWLKENVRPGRIISKKAHGNKFLMVLKLVGEKVIAIKEDGRSASLNLKRIKRIFANEYSLDKMVGPYEFSRAFDETIQGKNPLLERPNFEENQDVAEAIEIIDALLEKVVLELSEQTNKTQEELEEFFWKHLKDAEFIAKNEKTIDALKEAIWLPFEKRARVLAHFGYLNFNEEKVTEIGRWLADLRVDRPLLIGEALRRIDFTNAEPEHFAAFIGALAADRERNYSLKTAGYLALEGETIQLLASLEEVIFDISKVEWKYGIEPETEINFSAAVAVEKWAKGAQWKDLIRETQAEEGDLVRLLSRTGEVLLQIAHLKNLTDLEISSTPNTQNCLESFDTSETKTQPEVSKLQNLSKLSNLAAELILREPVR